MTATAFDTYIAEYGDQYRDFLRTLTRELQVARDASETDLKARVAAVIACRDAGLIARQEEAGVLHQRRAVVPALQPCPRSCTLCVAVGVRPRRRTWVDGSTLATLEVSRRQGDASVGI